jgi:hypothetical protein
MLLLIVAAQGSPQETQTVTNKHYFVVTDCVTRSFGIPVVSRDLKCVPYFMKNDLLFRILERGRGQTDSRQAEHMMIS